MALKIPPFRNLDESIDLERLTENNTLSLGQLRAITEEYSDDAVVWLSVGGRSSDVRPSTQILAATSYILIT